MAKLTFYGGAKEIGGNKILLEEGNAKVFLDFGESFDFGCDYFYEYLQPRSANGLECFFEFDLMPRIPRLYSEKMLRFTDMPYRKPDVDGVFITHHHSDHAGHLKFLDEKIPVYMGHGTKKIIDLYNTLYPGFNSLGEHEDIRLFKSGDRIEVNDLTFRPIHVEHSTPGAYGYVIENKDGNIVFTGDFRRHGPKQEYTEEFIEEARKARPKILLCEGTRMTPDPEKQYTEEQVYGQVKDIIADSKGLVFAHFAMSNIDRFKSIYKASVECGRKMVIDTRLAYILDGLREKIELPDPKTDENMNVYFRLAKSCGFCEKDYYTYERGYMDRKLTFKDIREKPEDYVLFTNFNKLMELVYIKPEKADYVYSSSEHFLEGEDNEDMRKVMYNWLDHFKVRLHKAHCSGHAGKKDLEYAVKRIKPDTLVPVHTLNPEEFEKVRDDVLIVEKEKTYSL